MFRFRLFRYFYKRIKNSLSGNFFIKIDEESSQLARLKIAAEGASKMPKNFAVQARYALELADWGRFEEAEEVLEKMLEKSPDNFHCLVARAKVASKSRNHGLAVEHQKKLVDAYPRKEGVLLNYIHFLLEDLQFEAAQTAYKKGLSHFSSLNFQLTRANFAVIRNDWETAKQILVELHRKDEKHQRVLAHLVQTLCSLQRIKPSANQGKELLKFARQLCSLNHKSPHFQNVLVEALILGNEEQAAIRLVESFPNQWKQKNILESKAWAAYMHGRVDIAQQIWDEIREIHYIPPIHYDLPTKLKRLDNRKFLKTDSEIRLYSVVKNELWRLPWFFNYYRTLGVERFIFVDNGSTDGTKEWLLEQSDTHVFESLEGHDKAHAGMKWVNHLVSEFGGDGWTMHVDVDEAFVFPNVEELDLRQLTNYLDAQGHDIIHSYMLDMFSSAETEASPDGFESDFIGNYPLFDACYTKTMMRVSPYQFVTGGARSHFHPCLPLTKTPLIRGGKNIQFLQSSHVTTPGKVSDVTSALLHFKLAGKYRDIFSREMQENTRNLYTRRRHQSYIDFFNRHEKHVDFSGPDTCTYKSSKTLLDLGLISAPDRFLELAAPKDDIVKKKPK